MLARLRRYGVTRGTGPNPHMQPSTEEELRAAITSALTRGTANVQVFQLPMGM